MQGFKKKWADFEEKHPKLAKLLYQLFYFWVFSMGVTVLQYLMFTFLPYLFGIGLAGVEFVWPQIPMKVFGITYDWNILGYEVARNAAGEVVIGGGLGYFISYEVVDPPDKHEAAALKACPRLQTTHSPYVQK